MEHQDRWNRRWDGRVAADVANDRGLAARADMEIVRSIGGITIAMLLRRDRAGDRRPLRRATR